MLTVHGRKRSFRSRAVATLRGVTDSPKGIQNVDTTENPNIITPGPLNDRSPVPSGTENKKDNRRKYESRGLTVDTKLGHPSPKPEIASTTIDTKLVRKLNKSESPKLSEAMMNKNWRSHKRIRDEDWQDAVQSPWSAPPDKFKFPDKTSSKPRPDDVREALDYDHGLERAAYRCSRPDNVATELIPFTTSNSVSAELCLSAPATKMEFVEAEIGTEARSGKYNPSVFQPTTTSVVRLWEMAPIKREGYEEVINCDEKHADPSVGNQRRLRDSSSIAVVSLIDPAKGWEKIEFPYAEIRAVESHRRFETGLSSVEETVRSQLSILVEPESAGLPPNYLRKEYEEILEERRIAVARAEANLEAPGRRGDTNSNQASRNNGVKDTGFNDLLGKLNKLCAPRIRAFTMNDRDLVSDSNRNGVDDKHQGEVDLKLDHQRSSSGDSGISGLSSGRRKRSSTLNPEASEFCCHALEKQLSGANACTTSQGQTLQEPMKSVTPTTSGCNLGQIQAPGRSSESADPIQLLESRVAELEAQIARQESNQGQHPQQKWPKEYNIDQMLHRIGTHGPLGMSGNGYHPAIDRGRQAPVGYQAAPMIPSQQLRPDLAMEVGALDLTSPLMNYCGLTDNAPLLPTTGMPAGLIQQCNNTKAMIPLQGHGTFPTSKPALGSTLWVKSMFGPKPVSKPDRPFRPGDGIQATRQQEYEEYLEHLRTTDPTYALSCKQRQARRADRQRSGHQFSFVPGQRQSY